MDVKKNTDNQTLQRSGFCVDFKLSEISNISIDSHDLATAYFHDGRIMRVPYSVVDKYNDWLKQERLCAEPEKTSQRSMKVDGLMKDAMQQEAGKNMREGRDGLLKDIEPIATIANTYCTVTEWSGKTVILYSQIAEIINNGGGCTIITRSGKQYHTLASPTMLMQAWQTYLDTKDLTFGK